MSVDENHPVFTCLKKLVNDPMLDRECFERICNARVFKWVAAYVITDAGRILVMELPTKARKAKNIQTFGGSVYGSQMTSEACNLIASLIPPAHIVSPLWASRVLESLGGRFGASWGAFGAT